MSRRRFPDRIIAGLLTLAMAVYWIPATAFAATTQAPRAEISGSILSADGLTGVAGVSVKAANMETSQIYTSAATAPDGTYRIADLPPGSYDLAIDTGRGLFAADAIVEAEAGKRTIVSIALTPAQEDEEQQGGQGAQDDEDEGEPEEPPAEPEPEKKKKKGGGFWRSPLGATVLIISGAVLIGAAANSATDNEDNVEPPMTGSGN